MARNCKSIYRKGNLKENTPLPKKAKTSKTINPLEALINEGDALISSDPNIKVYDEARDNSAEYVAQQNTDELYFKETLLAYDDNYIRKLFDESKYGIPLIFQILKDCNAEVARDSKIKLFNNALKVFILNVKNKRNGGPLEPSTTNVFLRRFFAHLKVKYQISFSIQDDFSFPGGFLGVLKELYEKRAKENPTYGTAANKPVLPESDEDIWERAIATLNRNDPKEMSMLILILCGCFFGLRGNSEHANLETSNIEHGRYSPTDIFHGYEYVGLTNLSDKTHRLGYVCLARKNTFVRHD